MNTPSPVEVVTFGCRLNACESDALRSRLEAEGATDTVVFNTCAVTAEAVRQARQMIRRKRRERPGARLVVTGCAAQIEPGGFAAMDEVDLVLGNAEKLRPDALTGEERVRVGDVFAPVMAASPPASTQSGRARAYVEIQNGCDHRCTFCVIPFGRGASRSIPAAQVSAQAARLAALGHAELVLTGVDLTSWGVDLPGRPGLASLISDILAAAPDLARLRLSSIDAAEIDSGVLELLATEPRLMPHLHLSLQSGDDLILKRMKRRHSRADALALAAAARAARPDVALGADFIAGFPTESEAAFENTLALVEEARLAYLHVFPYSPRPGTAASRMPQLPQKIIRARAARLRETGEAALRRHLDARVGKRVRALVERECRARAEDFTEVQFFGSAAPGRVISGRIAGHDGRRVRLDAWEAA